jgi:uncharacterized protein YbjT (DUF2867 family)
MIAITGATGNIGGRIAASLLAQGVGVRCIARTPDKLKDLAAQGAEIAAISLEDSVALGRVLKGADAVFAMIPPNYTAPDFRAYQNVIGASLSEAIEKAGVGHVVNLSSQGAHLPDRTGPVKGLHDQEERLNRLKGIDILHLRPTFFMENLLANIEPIKKMNIMGSAIKGDLKFPMIATKDIAAYATERLGRRDFSGISVKDLLGQRDISMEEIAASLSTKLERPDLKYIRFPYEATEIALVGIGFSADVSRMLTEMSRTINDGIIMNIPRTNENTTATTFEEFAEIFVRMLAD